MGAFDIASLFVYPRITRLLSEERDLDKFSSTLTPSQLEVFQRLRYSNHSGNGGYFELIGKSEADVLSVISAVLDVPENRRHCIFSSSRLVNCSADDMVRYFPTAIFAAMTHMTLADLAADLDHEYRDVLCWKLLRRDVTAWLVHGAMLAGVNCVATILPEGKNETKVPVIEKPIPHIHAKVMLAHIRGSNMTLSRDNIRTILSTLGGAIIPDDISTIQESEFRASLSEICGYRGFRQSVQEAVIRRVKAIFGMPTAWPAGLLVQIAHALEYLNIYDTMLLNSMRLVDVEEELKMVAFDQEMKRQALASKIQYSISPHKRYRNWDAEEVSKLLSWLPSNTFVLSQVNSATIAGAFSTPRLRKHVFSRTQVMYLADSLLEVPRYSSPQTLQADDIRNIGPVLSGFPSSWFQALTANISHPGAVLEAWDVILRQHLLAPIKAKTLLRFAKDVWPAANSTVSSLGHLFQELDTVDLDEMAVEDLFNNIEFLGSLNLNVLLTRRVLEKVISYVTDSNGSIHEVFPKLGSLLPSIAPSSLVGNQFLSLAAAAVAEDDHSKDLTSLQITKAQAYFVMDQVRERLGKGGGEGITLTPTLIKRLGRLVLGLTPDDIEGLPEDSNLLVIFDILSDYEDDMDSGQVEAIVRKIKRYYGMDGLSEFDVLTEVDMISVSQIGRFLQYLDVESELYKFPRHVRLYLSKKIGESRMNKISLHQQRDLFQFALRNMITPEGRYKDASLSGELTDADIEDLGHLKCGMTAGDIGRMTDDALVKNLEEMQTCPFCLAEGRALARAVITRERLNHRSYLAGMGSLFPYLDVSEFKRASKEELATVTETILNFIAIRDRRLRERRRNGFIREWTTDDTHAIFEGKVAVFQHLLAVSKEVSKSVGRFKCQDMMLVNALGDVKASEAKHQRTSGLEHLQLSDGISGIVDCVAGTRLSSSVHGLFHQKDAAATAWRTTWLRQPGLTRYLGALLPSIPAASYRTLPLPVTSRDAMSRFSQVEGFSQEQLADIFELWLSARLRNDTSEITGDELTMLNQFLCGADRSFIADLSNEALRSSLSELGKRNLCSESHKKEAFMRKIVDVFGGNIKSWPMYLISEIGYLIGGLLPDQLPELTEQQILAIAPEVITSFPVPKLKHFSVAQLQRFTRNQKEAITAIQRSHLSNDQMGALYQSAILNGGNGRNPSPAYSLTCLLFLLMLWQKP